MPSQIAPCLWFDGRAEEAAIFYTSVFKNGKVTQTQYYSEAGKEAHKHDAGTVMLVEFEINGQKFSALNGGPHFKFSEAISFVIECEDQEELDYYWEKLSEGGDPGKQQCGWVGDKFGVSWQVVPKVLKEMLSDPEEAKSQRTMTALMGMKKLDITALKAAYEG
jgi:predicted 3-demethylubiquinone-9 3-methyltransferase (glyoxalase superfamily)